MKKLDLKIIRVDEKTVGGVITKTYYKLQYRTRFLFWTWWTDYRAKTIDILDGGAVFRYKFVDFDTLEEAEFHKATVLADSIYYKAKELRQFLSYAHKYTCGSNSLDYHFYVNLSDFKYLKNDYLYDYARSLTMIQNRIFWKWKKEEENS